MTQEDKQLLLKDLCARIPYRPKGVKLNKFGDKDITITGYSGRFVETIDDEIDVERVRLYLRPMSSMTEEERKEINKSYSFSDFGNITIRYHMEGWWDNDTECSLKDYLYLINWLNAHHFDFRGFIERGLALEAPMDMYKTE